VGSRTGLDDVERLYTPEDYIRVMQKARKGNPLKVNTMMKDDFAGTSEMQKAIMSRKYNTSKNQLVQIPPHEN
jgi:hypothetical protein